MRDKKDVEQLEGKLLASIIYSCKKCKGTNKKCSCYSKYENAIAAYEACIPKDFQNIKKKDIKHNTDIFKKIIQKYVKNLDVVLKKGYGLLLIGDNGTGKTFFTSYILSQAIKAGKSTYYTTSPQLEYNLKRGWKESDIEKRLNWMLTSDFLAIDELGKEKEGSAKNEAFMVGQIERILKQKCDDNFPVLLATNRSLGEIKELYGSTVASIIAGKFKIVNMKAGDFRKELAKKMKDEMGY